MFSPQIKRILVPVDLSGISFNALDQAGEIAKFFGASIETVHVIPRGGFAKPFAERRKETLALIKARNADGRLHIIAGDPVPVLSRLASKLKPDLIVAGTHGRTGVKRLLLGSVAEAIIKETRVPVLVARRPSHSIRSILVPIEPTDYSIAGFTLTAMIAFDLRARVTVMNVTEVSDKPGTYAFLGDAISRMPPEVQRICEPRAILFKGSPVDCIASEAEKHDLVSLVYHRKPSSDWLIGTTLERVLRRCSASILAVPFIATDSDQRRRMSRQFSE